MYDMIIPTHSLKSLYAGAISKKIYRIFGESAVILRGKPAEDHAGNNRKEGFSLKKRLSILLLGAMLLSLTAGCGGEPKAQVPMGRYVEKPGQVLENVDMVDSMFRTDAGDMVFYGRETVEGKSVYCRYVMPSGSETVERTEVSWLNEFLNVEGKGRFPSQIAEGTEGTVYLLYHEIDQTAENGSCAMKGPLLARSTNGGTPEPIEVAELKPKDGDSGSFSFAAGSNGSFTFSNGALPGGEDEPGDGDEADDPFPGGYTMDGNGNFVFNDGEPEDGDGEEAPEGDEDEPGDALIPGESFDISTSVGGAYVFGGSDARLNCNGVAALEDGFLLLFGDKGTYRYNADGVKTAEFPGQAFTTSGVGAYKGTLLSPTAEGFATYDLETLKETGSYSYDNPDFYAHIGMDEKGIYLADSSGIYRQAIGGGILERLVDGGMTSLVMPNQTIQSIVSDGEDGFWAILSDGEDEYRLVHYDYDPDMPTDPDTELTIFALKDNSTVRQAIGEFQRANPNVRVNFRVAMGDDSAATAEDLIRTLNTEILNGKGPDLLLLDGLPVESYMEKGVLADLSGLLGELEGTLLSNLMEVYAQEGKVYGVPAKFTVPVMMGNWESLKGLDTLEELAGRTAQGGEPPFLRATEAVWDEEGTGMLMKYYDLFAQHFLKDGAVDQGALTDYFDAALKLDAAVKAYVPQSGDSAAYITYTVAVGKGGGMEPLDMGPEDLRAGKARVHLGTIAGVNNLAQALGNLSSKEGQAIESTFHKNTYTPVGTVGILEGSSQKELAMDFLRMMLSPTVQDDYVFDGFPVNAGSLEKLVNSAMEDNYFGASVGDGAGFLTLCRTLDTPILVDQVVKEAVTNQAGELLAGTVTPEEAAANVAEKLRLYLAE